MSGRKSHEWDYIAETSEGELSFCRLCNRYRFGTGEPFKATAEFFDLLSAVAKAKAKAQVIPLT